MTHTPGPWLAEPTVPSDGFNCWHITTPSGDIAWSKGYQHEPEKQANAHLIAAAPDMLAALIQARGALRLDAMVDGGGKPYGTTAVALEAIDAAISKATVSST